jgi:hypothetical protein
MGSPRRARFRNVQDGIHNDVPAGGELQGEGTITVSAHAYIEGEIEVGAVRTVGAVGVLDVDPQHGAVVRHGPADRQVGQGGVEFLTGPLTVALEVDGPGTRPAPGPGARS